MPSFIVRSGKIGRRELSGLVVYNVNDKIELTLASAIDLGAQVEPADRATAVAMAEATTDPAVPSAIVDEPKVPPPHAVSLAQTPPHHQALDGHVAPPQKKPAAPHTGVTSRAKRR